MKVIEIPTNCPICGSILELINEQLFCKNDDCSAQSFKNILHYIKKMKILGLGEKSLEKINIESINDLYTITEETLISKMDSEKLGIKIYNSIHNNKEKTLDEYLSSFGIPMVGTSASKKLALVTNTIWNINKDTCKEAGLGNVVTTNLLDWLESNKSKFKDLPIRILTTDKQPKVLLKVCVTGKLNNFSSREKAKQHLSQYGIEIVKSISSKVNYLVCDVENSSSSSYIKANKLNIPIVTMNEIIKLGENKL